MSSRQAEPEVAIAHLRGMLERSLAAEQGRADFYRQQRAELGAKLRIGLVTLNGASALGIATAFAALPLERLKGTGLEPGSVLASFLCYILGAWAAGWALNALYVDAINAEGDAGTRATTARTALDGVGHPDAHLTINALNSLQAMPYIRNEHEMTAIRFQALSWGLWGTGSLGLVVSIAWHLASPIYAMVARWLST